MRTVTGDAVLDPPEPVSERLLAGLSDAELSARLTEVFAAEQTLAAQRLALIAEIDGRGLPRREGATGTTAWLRDKLRVTANNAAAMLHLARDLATPALGATAQTLADGAINTDQATVITRLITDLPAPTPSACCWATPPSSPPATSPRSAPACSNTSPPKSPNNSNAGNWSIKRPRPDANAGSPSAPTGWAG